MSRLDRLVTLLETGSTPLVRNTAASQLADVQKSHPEEVFNLLGRVLPYLRSKKWDTRMAASKAVGGILEYSDPWIPDKTHPVPEIETIKKEEEGQDDTIIKSEVGPTNDKDYLEFDSFDIKSVIKNGTKLLGSLGKEYDYSLADLDPAERLLRQKQNVRNTLGMASEYLDDDLVEEKDFATSGAHAIPPTPRIDTSLANQPKAAAIFSPVVHSAMSPRDPPLSAGLQGSANGDDSALSKRQQNMMKRKAKQNAKSHANKVRVVDLSTPAYRRPSSDPQALPDDPTPHPVKQEQSEGSQGAADYFSLDTQQPQDDGKIVVQHKGPALPPSSTVQVEADDSVWPFERLADILLVDLFDPSWIVRHGAAMALRDLIRYQGPGAGRTKGKTKKENDAANKRWLDNIACRLCCIFVLDRFSDYAADNVVAPVREAASQALGALLKHIPQGSVYEVYKILRRMVMQDDLDMSQSIWEICHGGMLGLKYLVVVRSDLFVEEPDILDGVVSAVMKGLRDHDDDVRAESAATMLPIAAEFVSLRPHAVDDLTSVVWECLSHLKDDLTASTGHVMDLLAKLCSFPEVLETMRVKAETDPSQSFSLLVPRLFPFLRHTITSVRSAVLRALLTFLGIQGSGSRGWVDGRALRLIFQNMLVERNEAVLDLSLSLWLTVVQEYANEDAYAFSSQFRPHVDPLITLLMTPIGISRNPYPMDMSLFIKPSGQTFLQTMRPPPRAEPSAVSDEKPGPGRGRGRKKSTKFEDIPPSQVASHNLDGHIMQGDVDLVGYDIIMKTKISGAKALGKAMSVWPLETVMEVFSSTIVNYLRSPYSSTQLVAAMVVEEYCKKCSAENPLKEGFVNEVENLLNSERPPIYRDLVPYMKIVRSQCHNLLNTFINVGKMNPSKTPTLAVVVQGEADAGPESFSLLHAEKVVEEDYNRLKKIMPSGQRILATDALTDAKNQAAHAIEEAKSAKEVRDVRIVAAASGAMIAAQILPKKLNPVIRGVMDSVKAEENVDLQRRSAHSVAVLVDLCSQRGRVPVADKLTKNICSFLVVDTSETPEFHINESLEISILSLKKEEDRKDHADPTKFERESRLARIKRRGAKEALDHFANSFGKDLFVKVPRLLDSMERSLISGFKEDQLPESILDKDNLLGQEIIDGLSTIRALLPKFHTDLHSHIVSLFPYIIKALRSRFSVLRYAAAKCFATICSIITIEGMKTMVTDILPSISNGLEVRTRQGVIELIYHLISAMETNILPFVIFLIVPVLGRMSDSDNDIRRLATTAFATLIKLVPLEAGIPDPPGFPEELLKGRDKERKFIAQMLDVHKVEPFHLPVAIQAELRSYQQEGVNWLAFLNRYHLHGILCDDMGLGKTLQTICIVASDHHLRAEDFSKTQNPESRTIPSLIVCPSTLSGHWQQEIKQYAPFLTSLVYVGNPSERGELRHLLGSTDIVITSYDICRNDLEHISKNDWNYCVLDEGHIIKNSKAKLSQAVKKIRANHRLILSGTPIQNNVLELWSLFDFLMPGFLGTEKVFMDRFAKPIANSRNSKSSSKEQEAGALAIEALHKQVLPFVLRRLKEEVLDDLPPKIIQNYYCDLSDLQKQLYQEFSKKQSKDLPASAGGGKEAKQHIFQALQYMRKLCNSPALILNEKHPKYAAIQKQLALENTSIRDAAHAPKLAALRDLLIDCGIGATASAKDDDFAVASNAISQHRALIFCQLKEMLDIVESDVLKKLLPTVSYLRMDGATDPRYRQDMVTKFNSDPSIDVLLLTTHVGGLGLNLTGADTVIFVEHDWNPQKDMQAMDRAHRIGQKKVVNVYRLITRGTLEEKIMNLQRFKLDVASTVVNQQNAGLATMETDQLLDLFNFGDVDVGDKKDSRDGDEVMDIDGNPIKKGSKGILDDIGELWDENQYDELNLDSFIASMKS
ncbi:TATA-binding protein-associated factor mot1 [Orbilia ellipsospora]|uniref:TATA-binding protein-associated factor mot1 n=1 Tax=Orbilia ellipsospora TaxID=2528407 RepID=A0AAV9WTM1_9PEZI